MERLEFLQMLYWFAGEENYEIDGEKFENQPTYFDAKILSAFAQDIMDDSARKLLTKMFIAYITEGKYKDCVEKHEDTFKRLIAKAKHKWNKSIT